MCACDHKTVILNSRDGLRKVWAIEERLNKKFHSRAALQLLTAREKYEKENILFADSPAKNMLTPDKYVHNHFTNTDIWTLMQGRLHAVSPGEDIPVGLACLCRQTRRNR